MKILAKIIKTSAAIAALSAIAAIITGIVFESVKLTSYFLGIFIVLSLINLNIYIILGILGKDTKDLENYENIYDKAYKYNNANHNNTRVLCYINIYIIYSNSIC